MVLVTTRRRLAGLDHTHALSLDILPLVDAIALLHHTADESRLAGQSPELVAELVVLCGRLPLAIRVAAARLRSHPTWDLELRRLDQRDEVDLLHTHEAQGIYRPAELAGPFGSSVWLVLATRLARTSGGPVAAQYDRVGIEQGSVHRLESHGVSCHPAPRVSPRTE